VRNTCKILALTGLLAVLPLSHANAGQCQLKEIASLDMAANSNGMIVIPVAIGGTPRNMLVDTAGFIGFLNINVAKELNLKVQHLSNYKAYDVNGKELNDVVQVPEVGIGPSRGRNVYFMLDSDKLIGDQGVAGSIGPDLLRNFDIDLDIAGKKMNLFSQDHCPGKVVYWAHDYAAVPMKVDAQGHIKVKVNLDGQNVEADLDTGSSHSTLSLPVARNLFGIDTRSASVQQGSFPDGYMGYRVQFKNLSFEGVSVENPVFALISDRVLDTAKSDFSDGPADISVSNVPHLSDMILGMDVMRHLHMYIAYQERVLYITAADAH
jgi:predicted aspartyl protease